MRELKWLEIRRQLFHAFNGTVILLLLGRCGEAVGWVLLALSILGLGLSLWHVRVSPLPFAHLFLDALERPENMNLPGKGAILYGIGVGLSVVLFCPVASKGAVCALAYGDAASTIFGRLFGRRPVPWNRRLSWEGALAFAVSTFVLGGFFVGFGVSAVAGILGAVVETVPKVDDNLSIPVLVGYGLHLLMCG